MSSHLLNLLSFHFKNSSFQKMNPFASLEAVYPVSLEINTSESFFAWKKPLSPPPKSESPNFQLGLKAAWNPNQRLESLTSNTSALIWLAELHWALSCTGRVCPSSVSTRTFTVFTSTVTVQRRSCSMGLNTTRYLFVWRGRKWSENGGGTAGREDKRREKLMRIPWPCRVQFN